MAMANASVVDAQQTVVVNADYIQEVADVAEDIGGLPEMAAPEFREILT